MTALSPGSVIVLETVHGSRAYGPATASSDTDVKGVFVPSARTLHGFLGGPEQVELGKDHVLYDVRKFFALASACNPTLIELMYTDSADRRQVSAGGQLLLEQRDAFLSR